MFKKIMVRIFIAFIVIVLVVSIVTADSIILDRLNNFGGTGDLNGDYFYSVTELNDYYIAVGSSDGLLSSFPGGTSNQGSDDFIIAAFNKTNLSLVNISNFGGTNSDSY